MKNEIKCPNCKEGKHVQTRLKNYPEEWDFYKCNVCSSVWELEKGTSLKELIKPDDYKIMELDEINKRIDDLQRLRKKEYGVPLSGKTGSLSTLEYSKKLFKQVLECAAIQSKPIYIVCEEMNISSAQLYRMQKSRIGKETQEKIINYLKGIQL
jgi:hypothetical protein